MHSLAPSLPFLRWRAGFQGLLDPIHNFPIASHRPSARLLCCCVAHWALDAGAGSHPFLLSLLPASLFAVTARVSLTVERRPLLAPPTVPRAGPTSRSNRRRRRTQSAASKSQHLLYHLFLLSPSLSPPRTRAPVPTGWTRRFPFSLHRRFCNHLLSLPPSLPLAPAPPPVPLSSRARKASRAPIVPSRLLHLYAASHVHRQSSWSSFQTFSLGTRLATSTSA